MCFEIPNCKPEDEIRERLCFEFEVSNEFCNQIKMSLIIVSKFEHFSNANIIHSSILYSWLYLLIPIEF